MSYLQCDTCEGAGSYSAGGLEPEYTCRDCNGEGFEESGEREVWTDPVRSMITHDGQYLCGDCAQGTTPGSSIEPVDMYFNERTKRYSPVYGEFISDDHS